AGFSVFGGSIRVHDRRVVPPGGDPAIPLWEAAVGAKVDQPERFLALLFGLSDGRLAYLYDTIGQLRRPRAAFALCLWIDDVVVRAASFQALATTWIGAFADWRVRTQPFARQPYDAATVLWRVRVRADGRPVGPGAREFWAQVLDNADVLDDSVVPSRGA